MPRGRAPAAAPPTSACRLLLWLVGSHAHGHIHLHPLLLTWNLLPARLAGSQEVPPDLLQLLAACLELDPRRRPTARKLLQVDAGGR